MKYLLIIGARGWGREVYDIAKACVDAGADFSISNRLKITWYNSHVIISI